MTARAVVRILACFCVVLAMGCAGLAVAYTLQADELRCLRDAADEGLAGADCRPA